MVVVTRPSCLREQVASVDAGCVQHHPASENCFNITVMVHQDPGTTAAAARVATRAALVSLITLVSSPSATDRGHKHSRGHSVCTFWFKGLATPAARDDARPPQPTQILPAPLELHERDSHVPPVPLLQEKAHQRTETHFQGEVAGGVSMHCSIQPDFYQIDVPDIDSEELQGDERIQTSPDVSDTCAVPSRAETVEVSTLACKASDPGLPVLHQPPSRGLLPLTPLKFLQVSLSGVAAAGSHQQVNCICLQMFKQMLYTMTRVMLSVGDHRPDN